MEKLSLSGFVSLLPNNLIVFAEDGEFDVPVACGKDSVVSGISKKKNTKPHYSIPVKFVFKDDPPITIVKLTKSRFVVVCERKLFLYQLGGGCLDTYILKPNEGAPVRSASSSEENSRFYVGSEDGTISYFKVTNAAINFETKITTPHEVTCMAASAEELVTCDSQGCIYSWDIHFATPTLNWQLVIPPAMSSLYFSCVCLTTESAIVGTFGGEIIVVQKGRVLCSINGHSGTVSAITVKHNAAVSPQLCLSTGEDGKILIFTALGSVIKNDFVGDYLLTGARWRKNGSVMLSAYGESNVFLHPIQ